ncbi:MAG: methyltransferase domain-containing protein [Nannocystaceae bacterium]|nr:methyltransferase domain-containing protein [Nannocystaceae bacterium]
MRAAAILLLLSSCASAPTPASAPPSPEPVLVAATQTQPAAEPEPAQPEPAAAPETPNPVAVRINKKYETADAEGWEKRFERKGREVHDRQAAVLEALQIEPGSTAADVGVGSGLYTLAFADAVGQTGTVFAVDVQDYFLKHVQDRAKEAGVDNITFVKAEQRSANLDESTVDIIFMCDVFHHVEYPRTYLASLYAALKPGGRLAVIDFIAEEGKSKKWVLEHVRASPAEFRAEFEATGFVFERAPDLLEENFFHLYRKPE